MRKSTKVILIASALCFAVGLVFCVIGASQSTSYTFERKPWFGFTFNNHIDLKQNFNVKDFDLLAEYDGEEIRNLNCDMDALAINVVESEDEKCRIYIDNKKKSEEIEYYLEGGTLVLSEEDHSHYGWRFINFNFDLKRKLVIQLPKKVYEQLCFDIGAGGLKISSVEARKIEVDIDAGLLESDGSLKADHMTLEVGSGSANLHTIALKQQLRASVDVGNIEIDKIEADLIDLSCNVGNLDCEFADAQTIKADCDLGNINLKLAGNSNEYDIMKDVDLGDIDIAYSHGNKKGCAITRSLEVTCNLGNIDVSFEK